MDYEGGVTEAFNDGKGWYRTNKNGVRWGVKLRDAVASTEKKWPTPIVGDAHLSSTPEVAEKRLKEGKITLSRQVQQKWPTPRNRMTGGVHPNRSTDKFNNLESVISRKLWPTPRTGKTTDENEATWTKRQRAGKVSTPPLTLAVKMWGTPNAHPRNQSPRQVDHGVQLANQVGGQLNPDWVEWLMGWPIGWTSLEPLTKLLWLDWSIDPADAESNTKWPTPTDSMVTVGDMEQARFAGSNPNRPKYKDANKVVGRQGPVPRVATGIKDRMNRLKAIGNGMVPQCVAVAWKVLSA